MTGTKDLTTVKKKSRRSVGSAYAAQIREEES